MLTKAEDVIIRSNCNELGEDLAPPDDSAGWQFGGFHAVDGQTGLRLVSVWLRPRDESGESARQRLLAKLVAAVAPFALAASDELMGTNVEHGRAFLELVDKDPELKALLAPRVLELRKSAG